MSDPRAPEGGSAMRALQAANAEVEALRSGPDAVEDTRGLILRVANAIDRSLRRMLRDDESADLSIRLKALAPDELRTDSVLAELRRNERLPMELAAGVHEVFEARRRLQQGSAPTETDRTRAVQIADLLGHQIRRTSLSATPAVSAVRPPDDLPDETHEVFDRPERQGLPAIVWLAGALILTLFIATGVWYFGDRGPSLMDQGVALFESGEYAEAAQYFFRHAEANPGDVTPHLYLARIHRRMERPALAAEAIRQAEQIAPQEPAVHRELGFLLLDTDQPEVAARRFEYAIELDDQSSEAWVGLVRALREAGRGDEVPSVIADAPAEVRALLAQPQSDSI